MDSLYRNKSIYRPSQERVKETAKSLGIDLCPESLKQYTERIHDIRESYDKVYGLVEPKPPVKYPRTPGYRPTREENPDNAWYVKTNISGASSGKLWNLRVAVKDNICVSGVPMMNGSRLVEGFTPDFDATVITRILDQGGVVAGKASCCSFCWSGVSYLNDLGPVLHPLDPSLSAGGTSSGSAALVARGEVDLALGSDQGGSIRVPAAWCGIVGLKPTFGLVPYTGAMPKDPTLDHLGPMARTAKDCALLLEAIAGPDGMDGRQPLNYEVPEYSKLLTTEVKGLRIGALVEGFEDCEPGTVRVVRQALGHMSGAGALVKDVSVPLHKLGPDLWKIIDIEGTYDHVFKRGGGGPTSRGFQPTSLMTHLSRACKVSPNSLTTPIKVAFIHAEMMKEDTDSEFYTRATNFRMTLTAAYDAIFKDYDVIAMPTVRTTARPIPTKDFGKPENVKELCRLSLANLENTCQFDVTGHPAISVNAGCDDGLPVGLMFVAARWRDIDVLRAAHAYEVIRDEMVSKKPEMRPLMRGPDAAPRQI